MKQGKRKNTCAKMSKDYVLTKHNSNEKVNLNLMGKLKNFKFIFIYFFHMKYFVYWFNSKFEIFN